MTDIPTAKELEALFREGKMERLGMGSRRACYRIPGRKFCVKCYRSDNEIKEGKYNGGRTLSSSVIREICKARFDVQSLITGLSAYSLTACEVCVP